ACLRRQGREDVMRDNVARPTALSEGRRQWHTAHSSTAERRGSTQPTDYDAPVSIQSASRVVECIALNESDQLMEATGIE
ncbi:MAG: hypothetical protein MUQ10_03295, partial [Anaerolineae bacterium]|nr:hypothetical protein [Anaerolineae bacterium]